MSYALTRREYTITIQGAGLDNGDNSFTSQLVGSPITVTVNNFYFNPHLEAVRTDAGQSRNPWNRVSKDGGFELRFDIPFDNDIYGTGKVGKLLMDNAKVRVTFTGGGRVWTIDGLREDLPFDGGEPPTLATNILPYGVAPTSVSV